MLLSPAVKLLTVAIVCRSSWFSSGLTGMIERYRRGFLSMTGHGYSCVIFLLFLHSSTYSAQGGFF
jgi:hypothetical protein